MFIIINNVHFNKYERFIEQGIKLCRFFSSSFSFFLLLLKLLTCVSVSLTCNCDLILSFFSFTLGTALSCPFPYNSSLCGLAVVECFFFTLSLHYSLSHIKQKNHTHTWLNIQTHRCRSFLFFSFFSM
jgi:hypothetical protein